MDSVTLSCAAVCFLESPADIQLIIWLVFVVTKGLSVSKYLIGSASALIIASTLTFD